MSPQFSALCDEMQRLVPDVELVPWDPMRAAARYKTASHGERLALAFVLGVWNPRTKWKGVTRFDLFEAGHVLSPEVLGVIARWVAHPRYP